MTASIRFMKGNSALVAGFLTEHGAVFRAETHPGDATQDRFFIRGLGELREVVDGDWIVIDGLGDAYPCHPRVYAALHDAADETTSDGFHTFGELYQHRHALFAALASRLGTAWKSKQHEPGAACMFAGMFVAGATLTTGPVSYHLPDTLWDACPGEVLDHAPHWDGHTSRDVVDRLILDTAARIPAEPFRAGPDEPITDAELANYAAAFKAAQGNPPRLISEAPGPIARMAASRIAAIVQRALWGCEDGNLIADDDTSVPVGEYRRLLQEEALPPIARFLDPRITAPVDPFCADLTEPVTAADLAEPVLPTWVEMSDQDKAAAVLYWQACDTEGHSYAYRNYPCRYREDPALRALDPSAACNHADQVAGALCKCDPEDVAEDDVYDALGGDEWDRLKAIADEATEQAGAGAR